MGDDCMLKKFKFVSIVLVLCITLASCFGACSINQNLQDEHGNALSSTSNYPVSVFDVKFDSAPTAAVCFSESLTDILYALKYDSLLVARADTSNITYTNDLPTVGTASNINIDALVSLGVDFVLSEEPLSSKQISDLNDNGIKSLSFTPAKNFDELQSIYTNLGSIFGGAKDGYEAAYKKSNDIFITIENINKLITASPSNTVCYMYDAEGTVATGDMLFNEIIKLAGGVNIANDYTNYRMPVGEIAAKNPAFIFCPAPTKERIMNDGFFQKNLWAVNNSRVIEMSSELVECHGSMLIEAMTFVASIISPDLVSEMPDPHDSDSSTQDSSQSGSYTVPAGTTLKLGDTGDEVLKMQARLKELGHAYMDPTGTFDEYTEEAVKNFQYLSDFNATGIATEAVLNALYASDAVTGPNY